MAHKKLNVDLDEIARAMDDDREVNEFYIDMLSGLMVTVSKEVDERVFRELPVDDLPEWQQDELELARALRTNKSRYRHIPREIPHKTYGLMQSFVERLGDEEAKRYLAGKLGTRHPIDRFRRALYPHPQLKESWSDFERQAKRQWAWKWLRKLDIDPVDAEWHSTQ